MPDTVPDVELITDPVLVVTDTLYVPVPEQTPLPALIVGVIQPIGGVVQLVGEVTVLLVLEHPFTALAVITTLVPTAIPMTLFPETTPVEDVTDPLLLKLTSYVLPVHTAPETVKLGTVELGPFNVTISGIQPVAVAVAVTLVPIGIPVIAFDPTVPDVAVIVAPFGLLIEIL